jgi:hypothetical protein
MRRGIGEGALGAGKGQAAKSLNNGFEIGDIAREAHPDILYG